MKTGRLLIPIKSDTSWHGLADEMKDGSKIVPIVATKDARGTDRQGWSLTAKLDNDFTDSNGNILKGAELKLSNLAYANASGAPIASAGEITLSSSEQEVGRADATNGVGNWSIGMGTLQADGTTNGVTLSVPSTTVKNSDTYSTTVTWNLVEDPSLP